MVNKKKQALLAQEFSGMLNKAKSICIKCESELLKLEEKDKSAPLNDCRMRNQDLLKLINETNRNLGARQFNEKNINNKKAHSSAKCNTD